MEKIMRKMILTKEMLVKMISKTMNTKKKIKKIMKVKFITRMMHVKRIFTNMYKARIIKTKKIIMKGISIEENAIDDDNKKYDMHR